MIYLFSFWLTFRVRVTSLLARSGWDAPARYLVQHWQQRSDTLRDQHEPYRAALFAQAAHDLRLFLDELRRQRRDRSAPHDSTHSGNGHKP